VVDVAELVLSVGPSVYQTIFDQLMFDQLKEKRNVANKECGSKKSQACSRQFDDY